MQSRPVKITTRNGNRTLVATIGHQGVNQNIYSVSKNERKGLAPPSVRAGEGRILGRRGALLSFFSFPKLLRQQSPRRLRYW